MVAGNNHLVFGAGIGNVNTRNKPSIALSFLISHTQNITSLF